MSVHGLSAGSIQFPGVGARFFAQVITSPSPQPSPLRVGFLLSRAYYIRPRQKNSHHTGRMQYARDDGIIMGLQEGIAVGTQVVAGANISTPLNASLLQRHIGLAQMLAARTPSNGMS